MADEQSEHDAAMERRLRDADEREYALGVRESQMRVQEARQIKREQEVENVLAKLKQRSVMRRPTLGTGQLPGVTWQRTGKPG